MNFFLSWIQTLMNALLRHLIAMITRIAATHKVHTPVHVNLVTPETERTVQVRWALFLSCCFFVVDSQMVKRFLGIAFFLSILSFPFFWLHFIGLLFPLNFLTFFSFLFYLSLFSSFLCFFSFAFCVFVSSLSPPFLCFLRLKWRPLWSVQFQIWDGISLLLMRTSSWLGEVCRRFTWQIPGSLM